jgi:hypothetical protein
LDRQRIIERERRWATWAAFAAVLPLALYVASVLVEQSANVSSGGTTVDELRSLQGHSGTLLVAAILRGIGFLAMPVPLLYLFRAAQARNPRVQPALVGFVFIGPLLFAAQGVVAWKAQDEVASDFEAQAPLVRKGPLSMLESQLKTDPKSIEKVTVYTDGQAADVEYSDGSFRTVENLGAAKGKPSQTDRLLAQLKDERIAYEVDSEGKPGEALADKLVDDSAARQVAASLLFPAVLALIVVMIYVPLQSMRAGLLTRFFGTLGMALGGSMILVLPLALLGTLVWLGYLGLLFVGRAPGGRPPSWDAGEAVPWPAPGEEAATATADGETIEGEAREIEDAPPSAPSGEARSKKKRKRRG